MVGSSLFFVALPLSVVIGQTLRGSEIGRDEMLLGSTSSFEEKRQMLTTPHTLVSGVALSVSGDDAVVNVPLPFTVNFYGNLYDSLSVCTNGFVQFGGGDTSPTNSPLSSSPVKNTIAPFWDDLTTERGNKQSIYTAEYQGSFIIQWTNMLLSSATTTLPSLTFQLWLEKDSNNIGIYYQTLAGGLDAFGQSATIGIINSDGSIYHQVPYSPGELFENRGYFYKKVGPINYVFDRVSSPRVLLTLPTIPSAPTLTFPAQGANLASPITFKWSVPAESLVAATFYRLYAANSTTFGNLIIDTVDLTTNEYTYTGTPTQGIYSWRVYACSNAGCAESTMEAFFLMQTTKSSTTKPSQKPTQKPTKCLVNSNLIGIGLNLGCA